MGAELLPCPAVAWCAGHTEQELQRMQRSDVQPGDETIHAGEPELVLELPANGEDVVLERQLVIGEGREFYFMYANVALVIEVDDVEKIAAEFERGAERLRELARSAEVKNARRAHE